MWQTAPASLSPLPISFLGRGRLCGSDVFDESTIDVLGTLISQQLSICDRCLPQEIVQAVGTTVRASPPRAGVPERLEQREGKGLVEDDQRPTNAWTCGQRVQKWRFPFHNVGVGCHMDPSQRRERRRERHGFTRLGDSSAKWW